MDLNRKEAEQLETFLLNLDSFDSRIALPEDDSNVQLLPFQSN